MNFFMRACRRFRLFIAKPTGLFSLSPEKRVSYAMGDEKLAIIILNKARHNDDIEAINIAEIVVKHRTKHSFYKDFTKSYTNPNKIQAVANAISDKLLSTDSNKKSFLPLIINTDFFLKHLYKSQVAKLLVCVAQQYDQDSLSMLMVKISSMPAQDENSEKLTRKSIASELYNLIINTSSINTNALKTFTSHAVLLTFLEDEKIAQIVVLAEKNDKSAPTEGTLCGVLLSTLKKVKRELSALAMGNSTAALSLSSTALFYRQLKEVELINILLRHGNDANFINTYTQNMTAQGMDFNQICLNPANIHFAEAIFSSNNYAVISKLTPETRLTLGITRGKLFCSTHIRAVLPNVNNPTGASKPSQDNVLQLFTLFNDFELVTLAQTYANNKQFVGNYAKWLQFANRSLSKLAQENIKNAEIIFNTPNLLQLIPPIYVIEIALTHCSISNNLLKKHFDKIVSAAQQDVKATIRYLKDKTIASNSSKQQKSLVLSYLINQAKSNAEIAIAFIEDEELTKLASAEQITRINTAHRDNTNFQQAIEASKKIDTVIATAEQVEATRAIQGVTNTVTLQTPSIQIMALINQYRGLIYIDVDNSSNKFLSLFKSSDKSPKKPSNSAVRKTINNTQQHNIACDKLISKAVTIAQQNLMASIELLSSELAELLLPEQLLEIIVAHANYYSTEFQHKKVYIYDKSVIGNLVEIDLQKLILTNEITIKIILDHERSLSDTDKNEKSFISPEMVDKLSAGAARITVKQ